jgi:hypothetical protein
MASIHPSGAPDASNVGAHDLHDRVPDDLVAGHAEPVCITLAHPQVAHRRATLRGRYRQCAKNGVSPPKGIRDDLEIAHDDYIKVGRFLLEPT